jgi:hypothetical protein
MKTDKQININLSSGKQIGAGKNSICFKVADLDNPNKFYAVLIPQPEIYPKSSKAWEHSMKNAQKRGNSIRRKVKNKGIVIPKIHEVRMEQEATSAEKPITFPIVIMDLIENTTIVREDTLTKLSETSQNKIVNALAIFMTTLHGSHLWDEQDEPEHHTKYRQEKQAILKLLQADKMVKIFQKHLIAKKQNKPINGFVDYNSDNIRFDKNHNLVVMDFASAGITTPAEELSTLARINSPTLLKKIVPYFNQHSQKIKIKSHEALKSCVILDILIDQVKSFISTDGRKPLDDIRINTEFVFVHAISIKEETEAGKFRDAINSFTKSDTTPIPENSQSHYISPLLQRN